MKISVCRPLGLISAACLCVASVSFGAPTTAVQLTSGGGDNGGAYINSSEGGIYTSPYQMSVGGTITGNSVSAGTSVPLICDDFADNINVGEFWSANVTDLAQLTGGTNTGLNVYYGTSIHPLPSDAFGLNGGYTQTELYVAAASLAVQILQAPTGADAPELSLALWEIFQPQTVKDDALKTNYNSQATIDAVNTYYTDALSLATTGGTGGTPLSGTQLEVKTGWDIEIYTPVAGTQRPVSDGAPQEFLGGTHVPEPSTWAVLGFDFVGAGIVGLYFRRRSSRVRH